MFESARALACNCGYALCIGLLTLAGSSCATFRGYEVELNRTLDLISSGEIERALDVHERYNRFQKTLLYYMEKGELLRLAGRYDESQLAWLEADQQVREWEDKARLNPDMLLRDTASLLVNDTARAYQGQDFEKVMLTTRMALNHLALGQWDLARVAIKRTHEREALIAELRAEQVRRSEEIAKETGETRDFRELSGYPVQTINSPEVNALRNSYQSAFSHYLAGFVYEALGESGLAAAGYRQAIELQPGIALLEEGLSGLDARILQARGAQQRDARTELLVVIETGTAPARSSVNLNLPMFTSRGLLAAPVSFPVLRWQEGASRESSASIDDGEQIAAVGVTSVDLMARRALQDEMPWIILRAIARATAKVSLQRAAVKSDDSGLAGALAIIGTIVTERADERGWRSLPAGIAIARLNVQRGVHELTIDAGNQRHQFDVDVEGDFALVSVRLFSGDAYVSVSRAQRGAR